LEKLVAQARLQCETRADRVKQADAPPRFEILPFTGPNGEPLGLAALPPDHPGDVFFDMEGYPLVSGGLEYLFGASTQPEKRESLLSMTGGHMTADAEKLAFEGFVDWVYDRWKKNPGMHIYHYAAYEVSAVRRLSTRHDTRQDQVDELLRHDVFIDLYQIVGHGLRIGEDSYSIKKVERLYRPKRATDVATAVDSIVQYARWIESKQPGEWAKSPILKGIRDYNEDDCKSTAELLIWLRKVAAENKIPAARKIVAAPRQCRRYCRLTLLRASILAHGFASKQDETSIVLADLIDFHRREEKPMWWRMFDRAETTADELRDDPGCIEGIQAVGSPVADKQSLIQTYAFDPAQECKLAAGDKTDVMFSFNLEAKLKLVALDIRQQELSHSKLARRGWLRNSAGHFRNKDHCCQTNIFRHK
jgi:hypothetical protein